MVKRKPAMTPKQFIKTAERKGLNTAEVADALGKTWRHIMRYRSGDTPVPKAVAMALQSLPDRKGI